jgi:hypothetical protein
MADLVIFLPEESYTGHAGPSMAGQQVGAPGEEKWTLSDPSFRSQIVVAVGDIVPNSSIYGVVATEPIAVVCRDWLIPNWIPAPLSLN